MARKLSDIKTESFCYINGVQTNTEELTAAQKQKLATTIQLQLLRCLYGDRTEFWAIDETGQRMQL